MIVLDLGSKRIGVSICDDKQLIATPLKTINRNSLKELIDELRLIINENDIKGIIIGNPLNMDGSSGRSAQSVKDTAENIEKHLKDINLVLVMTVYPGFGGQKFISKILDKIKNLKKIKDEKNLNFEIEVDGGINFENNKLVIDAGANILVSGTTIFKDNNGDIKKNIELLRT